VSSRQWVDIRSQRAEDSGQRAEDGGHGDGALLLIHSCYSDIKYTQTGENLLSSQLFEPKQRTPLIRFTHPFRGLNSKSALSASLSKQSGFAIGYDPTGAKIPLSGRGYRAFKK